ncbi:MAG: methionine adenosyltransferase [Spirochaetales bacterium]|nr:methionine adenosyltransferase [Spirochaetales bacterium]
MKDKKYLFTSESVSEGHPDKVCDQISDAVLDACLEKEPNSRVACEVYTTTGMVLVGGELTVAEMPDIQKIARDVVKEIGYDNPDYGIDYKSMAVLNTLHSQSPDIAQGVVEGQGLYQQQGAGDQGMMFGYACRETDEYMPAPIIFSHKLLQRAANLRKSNEISWMRPDSKSQVTIEYDGHKPVRINTVVLSHQHHPEVSYSQIVSDITEYVIKPELEPTGLFDKDTRILINPTGRFVIGGPYGDAGLTGRKIIVDTYGGMGRHGGGAFSGKDPSKVDRSAAYMARYIAKNITATGVCERCEVQLSYAIGYPEPVSIMIDTFDTGEVAEHRLIEIVREVFDLSPAGIISSLDLKRPVYQKTASYGHFGRDCFSWEKLDKVDQIKKML